MPLGGMKKRMGKKGICKGARSKFGMARPGFHFRNLETFWKVESGFPSPPLDFRHDCIQSVRAPALRFSARLVQRKSDRG